MKSSSSHLNPTPPHPIQTLLLAIHQPPPTSDPLPALRISEEDVNKLFQHLKARKASGPVDVSPSCPRACADQLAPSSLRSSTSHWSCVRFPAAFFCLYTKDSVATCMLSMRDCCKVNASDCPLSLHAHPGGVNAASH
ncbi:hypothetical protein XENORESO_010057 [Xenotaenia resolanae]|uniref:Uncharacterized protein n=1 Tax=Xenotaenia resolanae TaxID=208358 RepID=A0ABV0VQ78_9TELE